MKETAKNAMFLCKGPDTLRYPDTLKLQDRRGRRKEKTLRPLRLLCDLCG